MVVREQNLEGQTSQERGYYPLSGTPTARSFASMVRKVSRFDLTSTLEGATYDCA
jgi:hypothetical protein